MQGAKHFCTVASHSSKLAVIAKTLLEKKALPYTQGAYMQRFRSAAFLWFPRTAVEQSSVKTSNTRLLHLANITSLILSNSLQEFENEILYRKYPGSQARRPAERQRGRTKRQYTQMRVQSQLMEHSAMTIL